MVRVDIWVSIDQDSGQCGLVLYRRGFIVDTGGGRRYKYAAATLESIGAWPGQGGGQGLPWTRGMAVLAVPPPGQVMIGARGQGAGGQGAGCAQVGRGGASRPPANQRRGVGGQTLQTANQRREENIFFQANIFPENRLRDHINK